MGGKLIQEKTKVSRDALLDSIRLFMEQGFSNIVAITGVDRKDNIELIYHLGDEHGGMVHLSVQLPKGDPVVDDISSLKPGAKILEREVHDLFGVEFWGFDELDKKRLLLPECYPEKASPPLLKDVDSDTFKKYIGDPMACAYEALTLSAPLSPESALVPIGPYHPALKEPEFFSLVVEGERIKKAFVRIGFVHRGIEKLAESRTYIKDIFLFERVCGICSTHHAWTFVEAVEKLLNVDPPPRAQYLRTLIAELERIHSHSLWLGLIGYWIGFESMFMWVWGLRETVMDLFEELTGNRVHKSFITIGGVRMDISDEKVKKAAAKVSEFEKQIDSVMETVMSSDLFIERSKGIAKYTLEEARAFSAVGPVRRAAGDPYDIRRIEPYGAYGELDFEVRTTKTGDVYNLVLLRLGEIKESARIIRQIAEKIPSGNPVPPKPFLGVVKEGEAYARTEAPRGELFYYVNSNNTAYPYRVKVRTPTLLNIQLAAHLLEGATLSDFPVIVTSIDPCFSCMDRVLVYDERAGCAKIISAEEIGRKRM
ncbi:Membrane-bound hydrogenase, subunit NuoCD [Thermogladius calderae 1633]|uniref:Membrane-bound hydrogenase, subunit NuoCD n=1 Tax=Thermogladius calderae (strain DSM 22663 / VKM B-2946 / 1633) TaxID=1184251 RepID=I3TEX8_THEC1|nr:NADH-quinone oxidoreductase subunit D [Thermogladius calderae]AFK51316.1 Membrane-bound hydrogenase, subunit NuoCD [Thermogladius calderae 1633]